MMNDAYHTAKQVERLQSFRGGYVRGFDPDKRVYLVDLDQKGETPCKQLDTGVLKPYPSGSRVLAAKFVGTEWVILGEIPQSATSPQKEADSEEETLARGRGRLTTISTNQSNALPSFRSIDPAGQAEDPVFAGDLRLENRSERNITKSFFQIFRFGDLMIKSSNACFILLNKLRSTIVMKGRDLMINMAGYKKKVTTPSKGDLQNRTTVVEEFRADPLQDGSDLVHRSGDLTSDDGTLVLGTETTFDSGFEHLDLTQKTKRLQVDGRTFILGSLSTSLPNGELTLNNSPSGNGFLLETSKGWIAIEEDEGRVTLQHSDGKKILFDDDQVVLQQSDSVKMTMSDSSIKLEKSGQTFEIADSGVTIDATNLDITVQGQTSISSSGPMALEGATIDLN